MENLETFTDNIVESLVYFYWLFVRKSSDFSGKSSDMTFVEKLV